MEATVRLTLAEFNKAVKDAFTMGWNSRQRAGDAGAGGSGYSEMWNSYYQQTMNDIANSTKRKK